jgi:hypothetical protein
MQNTLTEKLISSPASTGGAGTFFEQHVAAYWLVQLLVRGISPILLDCAVVEVHLQTEHLGWHTDDFLIIGEAGAGNQRKLVGQVKRTFTVSATDEECRKTVQDFWKDFRNASLFSPATDRFALVTLRGTNTLLEHFAGLLDCSRAARDGAEFEHRLSTPGFMAAKAIRYCDEIRKIIGEIDSKSVTAAEIWPFLRVQHVLSFDLDTSTGQAEATIRTLLAHTTGEPDAKGAADNSWNALLAIAGEALPQARSFRRDDLPEILRQRHSPLGGTEQRVLRALNDHSTLILRGIRSTIGNEFHLQRASLVQQVIGQMESSQVVLVSGPAGSGKSAIAKDAIAVLSPDYFTFCFRAEEFAQPHFDATLQNSQIPASVSLLEAILAGQDRKVLLIESVERLLEKSTREAFTDVLTLAATDKSLRIVLTCRDYSTDLVRSCFLEPASVPHSVVTVPRLNDTELAEVEAALPVLAGPLSSPALRRVLRNPYFLDKALQIAWSAERPLPDSEREFRALFWQQIVRVDHHPGGGMPRRREETFQEIAVRRARALTAYIPCDDLDPEVVEDLRRDSLVASPETSTALVAPAHDVLEDWAILQWIEEQHLTGGSFQQLFATIGTHPAVRRGYRKWVAELLDRDAAAADQLFLAAVTDAAVPVQFRDDTLVSLLKAPSSAAFLERHCAKLLENNQDIFKRAIHLLRVACVTTPEWAPLSGHGSLLNIPDGSAWACVLRLVQTHIEEFTPQDRFLLLGLVEDWSRAVSLWTPYPDGADSAALIAHWLLPGFDNYRSEDQRKRTLKVIAKIPKADLIRFEELLRGTDEDDRRDRVGDDFRDMVLSEMEGTPAARDVPDIVTSVATDYILCSESDIRRDWQYTRSFDFAPLFGLKEGLRSDYFPPSAYRGPFLPLLRHHPSKGVNFVITVFNHSADWYANPRVSETVEPPFKIEVKFADETSRTQWGNPRLWNWYRGTSVGPYALQSLLMALERWLLEYAETYPGGLYAILLGILRRSESAALTAVVVSVATAFPHASGEALLVLLRSRMCILLDRQRMVNESHAPSRVSSFMPTLRPENKIYDLERKDADARPHRQRDLENAIMNLQLGPLASRVHEILDQHRATLPPISEQNDNDRIWRLAMHRMDMRQYTANEEGTEADVEGKSGEPSRYQIRLDPNEPEPDVKEMVDKNTPRFDAMKARLGLLMWGLHIFKPEGSQTYDPSSWRERLLQARASDANDTNEESLGARNGPGVVAAVCVRDHWQEMSDEDRDWCAETVCTEVMRQSDGWDYRERMQRFEMSADRSCASVLPLLLGKSLASNQRSRVQQVFVAALTHPVDEVRWYAAWGFANHLWSIDRGLALRSANTLATEATLVDEARHIEDGLRYDQRRQIGEIEREAAAVVRQQFWQADSIASSAYEKLDVSKGFGAEANGRILAILGQGPTEPAAIAGFLRAAQTLVAWWDADDARDDSRPERNHETETALSKLLQSFLMRTTRVAAEAILQPILDAIDRQPDHIHWLIQGLTSTEDGQTNTPQFWFLWEVFATRIRHAEWLDGIDDEHAIGAQIISAIFLGT